LIGFDLGEAGAAALDLGPDLGVAKSPRAR
jgi:hypothetical protein